MRGGRGEVPRRLDAARPRPADQRVEGRRDASSCTVQRLAAGGRERRRVPPARHARDRLRPAASSGPTRPRRARSARSSRSRSTRSARACATPRPRSPRPRAAAAAAASAAAGGSSAGSAAAAAPTTRGRRPPRPRRRRRWRLERRRPSHRRAPVLTLSTRPSRAAVDAPRSGSHQKWSTTMAKPAASQAEEEGLRLLQGEDQPTSTTRTRRCCGSSSPTAARSAPAA